MITIIILSCFISTVVGLITKYKYGSFREGFITIGGARTYDIYTLYHDKNISRFNKTFLKIK